ncbi:MULTISPECIES: CidA/LrgA family protein [Vibrio]|uniref:CidA/LrgA family protein n=2 Tax=Vibrio TaxID=662 RepID=A0A7X4LMJ9_9VIBR|nr:MULTISPECIES: CidA/LrgA family protein [Vibrio]MBF9000134.1 CidA/LrgA family protein [Vibrio nitrifigilis]MZI94377.1 CidA/LrgA family protein [Vibrio eleionomae]
MLNTLFKYIVSFALIFISLAIGNWIQKMLGVAVPGSIFGMLILFALLASGLAPVDWVRPGCHIFIRYMMLLFVPISVGLMNHFDMLLDNAWSILASAIGGSAIVMVTLSLILDRYLNTDKKPKKEKKLQRVGAQSIKEKA